MLTPGEQLERIRRGAADVFPENELLERLAAGTQLRVKLGVDPTAPDIHLGHTVALQKLRTFQDLGHLAVLIIGDYTARIGDPSGRSATRPPLAPEEIDENARTYEVQVFKVLDRERTEIRRNSEWLGAMGLDEVLRLTAQMTVARMLEREDFRTRYQRGTPIGVHEFLYPLMQGYDSVVVRADVELGGTDQTFNLTVGRDLQRTAGQPGQAAVLLPLLEGLDGRQKMSKSLDNQVGITDSPVDMYGKVMSISDGLMRRWIELLSGDPTRLLADLDAGDRHPMDVKKDFAREIVTRFHDEAAAEEGAAFFMERFQRGEANDPEVFELASSPEGIWVGHLLKQIGFAASSSAARRLAAQGGVRVDGEVVDENFRFRPGTHRLIAVGRRRLARIEPARGS